MCYRCGVEGEREEAFIKTRRFGRLRAVLICPPCWQKKKQNFYWGILGLVAAQALLGTVLMAFGLPEGWLLLNLVLYDLFLILGVLPHEFGHALAAHFLNMRLFQVIIGFGQTVFEWQLFGVPIQFRSFPTSGFTVAVPRSRDWFRLKTLFFIGAGPLANLMAIACIWPWVRQGKLYDFGTRLCPWSDLAAANLITVLINLFPIRVRTHHGIIGSDGLQLITIPFLNAQKIRSRLTYYRVREGWAANRAGDIATAQQWFEKAVAEEPNDFMARNDAGGNLLDARRLEEAQAFFRETLENLPLTPIEKALTQNNLAYTSFCLEKADLLPEANQLSRAALAALPTVPAIKGTRGAILCAMENYDEGIPLLKQAMQESTESRMKANNACTMALVERKRGNLKESEAFWESALLLDPFCPLLKKRT